MNATEAAALLGLSGSYESDHVKAAYRMAAAKAHPDAGGDGDIDRLRKARDVLLGTDCPFCKGTGHTGAGFKRTPCVRGCTPKP